MERFSFVSRAAVLALAVAPLAGLAAPAGAQGPKPPKPAAQTMQTVRTETRPLMEMVFVLDTTGSMSGLLQGAKQRIWGIVNDVMDTPAERRPQVRIGLVAYRDNGDQYVTQITPLTSDLDKVYSALMRFEAGGGGDGPENVRRALAEGVSPRMNWTSRASLGGRKAAQILFLVGDAPPHNYQDQPDVLVSAGRAVSRGVVVNTIQCGSMGGTREVWQSIARRGEGQYFAIAQDGGVDVIPTPYDTKLGALGTKIGGTYLAYGGGAGAGGDAYRLRATRKAETSEREVAMGASSGAGGRGGALAPAAADRAVNKALNAYAYDRDDLLTALENKTTTLAKVKEEDLPQELRKLPKSARAAWVNKRLAERKALRAEILTLSKKRDAFLKAEQAKRSKNTKSKGFDASVGDALTKQASRRGIRL